MKIIRQLTWRYMMKNKKRTLVTIFGAIISVAMLTAVFTSIVSFMDLFRRIAIEESGNWHARFMDVTMENVQTLKDDPDIASVGLYLSLIHIWIQVKLRLQRCKESLVGERNILL